MTSIVHDLAATAGELQHAFHRQVGMTRSRVRLLTAVPAGGEIGQAELRDRLGLAGAVMTRLVKELERDGLVTRRLDPSDNRYTLVALTPAGRSAAEGLAAAHAAFLDRLLRDIDAADERAARRVLAALRAACSDPREDAS